MKKYLLVVLVIFISHIARSQCMQIEIPLEERINASSIIVEGEVIAKQSYWDAKQQNIFTVNTVKPYKTFKGSLSNTAPIEIITLGGTVADTKMDVSNALQLNTGDIGMFLLKASSVSLTKRGNFLTTVEGTQGSIKYDRYDASASDGFKRYTSVVSELYPLIQSKAGRSFTTLEAVNIFQDTSRRVGSISNISPTTANAGVSDILTINGSGFGSSQGHIDFIDANGDGTAWISTFPSDVISWSATQIKVKVISRASTGLIRIIDSSNGIAQSSQVLTVNWAHSNPNVDTGSGEIRYENTLRGKDANGGYEFKFAPNFSATNVQDSFNRALATWNCGSGVNFEIAGSTTVDEIASDGTNVIVYQALGLGTLASAITWSTYCTINGVLQGWYVSEMDIRVNSNQNWHYGNGIPGDITKYNFETVALHELGHAQQLGHVGQQGDIMYYSLAPGTRNAELSTETLNGANYVMNKSTTTSVCGQPVMTPYAGSICCNDPEIVANPINTTNCINETENFSITANYATGFQWEVNTGSAWATITNNTTYSGAQSSTLSVTKIATSMNGYQYRCIASNSCTNTATSNAVTLTADKPEVTLSATEETPCDTNDGTITFTFLDNPNRTGIQFSINGGTTYTSIYDDNSGSVTLTDLAPNTYSVYSRWGNGQCEVEVGDITVVERTNPEASVVDSTPSDCSSATGSVTLNWVVDPIRTDIEFSTDGGVSYPHSTTNPSGTITIGSLPSGTTDLWVRWGNADCPIDMEDVTISNSNCDFSNGFITTWETVNDGTTNSNSIAIPIASTGTYNYHVDWGDGQFDYNVTGGITHPYATPGTYQVKIIGDFPHIYFNNTGDKQKILSVEQWGANSWSSMENAFHGCNNLIINATDNPDLSNVTDMSFMFTFCSSFNQDINTWDVSNVTNMAHTFRNTAAYNQNLSGWVVSNVTNMTSMFWNANVFNQDISAWDVSSVTNMSLMFRSADNFNQDIGAWDVGKVTNMNLMLAGALSFDQNLGNWDISSVTNMSTMFFANSLSIDNYDATLIGWSTLVTTGANPETQIPENITFSGANSQYCIGENARNSLMASPYDWIITDAGQACASAFITTWKTDNPGTSNANSITIPTQGTDPYNYNVDWGDGLTNSNIASSITHQYATAGTYTVTITGDYPWFWSGSSGDKDKLLSVEQWGDQVWQSMHASFYGCSNVVINATDKPDLSQVTSFYRIFRQAPAINQAIIGTWDVGTITNMEQAFTGATTFNQDVSSWDMSNVTTTLNMFSGALAFNQNISGWDVGNVTNISHMFRNAVAFNQAIGSWDVKNVEFMNRMFEGAVAFNQDLGNWDISKVTNMASMFDGITLSVSNYDNTLVGWNTLVLPETQIPENINFGGGDSKFCAGEAARTSLMSTPYSWTIIDGDKDCPDLPFITTWQTTAANETITIPTTGTGYNYDIDWDNNGTFDDFGITGNATHTYATAGTHTIAIRGDFPRIYFNYGSQRTKIVSIDQWGTGSWTNMRNAFMGCNNLVINAADSPDLSNVTDMSSMFAYNAALNQNLNHWDVTNITNMQLMFYQATAFNQKLSNWNVGNVTNMNNMFNNATSFNQDLSTWNVRQVTTMNGMFYNAIAFDQDIGDWDISAVLNIDAMFENVTLSVINYDNLLIGWNTQDVGETIPLNLTFHAGDSNYCNGDAARDNLITTHGWSITDGNSCVGFVTTWETTTANETITIPTTGAGYNYDIDWESDGIYDDFGVTGNATHTYVNPGIYTVTIKGDFPQIYFNYSADRNKILAVEKWGISNWRSMQKAFAGCSNLVIIAGDNPDLSNVTNMSHMFSGVATIIQDLSSWDVSNVTDMSYTFDSVNSFNQDISSWDVSNVTDMSYMFRDASTFNKDISSWNVSNVTNMSFMFSSTNSFNQNLSSWDVSGVTDMSYMFYYAFKFNQDISNWDVSSVTTMENMFATAKDFNKSLSSWDVSSVTNMASMFNNADDFNADLSGWNVGNVTTMESMFSEAAVFNQDINLWNVINVTNMSNLFYEASAFNQELSNWDVDNVASMSAMFASASVFNKDISSWNVGSVTDMFAMFSGASAFNQNIGAWNVGSVADMSYMFSSSGVFNQDLGSWNVSNVKYMIGMFYLSTAFNRDLGNWDIGLVTNMTNMFYGVTLSISNYDNTLIGWNTIVAPETQIQTGVSFSGGNSKYCAGEAAKDNLTNPLGHGWTIIDEGSNCAVISPKVILQGAALNPDIGEESLMRDDLRVAGFLPVTSPYADGIEVNATVFNTGGTLGTGPIADNIVDWVYVELRDKTNNTVVLAGQSALLQRDGNVVAIDGLSSLSFDLGADNYYVVVKHRNHLGVMTANPVVLGVFAPTVDFTDANNPITYGNNAQSSFGMPSGILGMWTGDANNDGRLNYLGAFSESPSIRNQVFTDTNNSVFGGPPSPSYSSLGYFNTDVDMNGSTKYLGTLSDVLSVRNNIFNNPSNSVFGGPPSPTYLFLQQLPEGANN